MEVGTTTKKIVATEINLTMDEVFTMLQEKINESYSIPIGVTPKLTIWTINGTVAPTNFIISFEQTAIETKGRKL